jgi:hypothetical protein
VSGEDTVTIRVRHESMGSWVVEEIDPETGGRKRSTIAVRCQNIAEATSEVERKLLSLRNRRVPA